MMKNLFRKIFYTIGLMVMLLVPFTGAQGYPLDKLADISGKNLFSMPTPGQTVRVSVHSDGTQANNQSTTSAISADGRYVVFRSYATNLVLPITTGHAQLFLRDLQTNTTSLVSVNNSGQHGNTHANQPAISADGRFVAFSSGATNLVSGINNGVADIFVRDTHDGVTTRVSVATGGGEANGASSNPSISADGRYVAFMSWATNLDSRALFGVYQVYVHDRETGDTTMVSIGHDGKEPTQQSRFPSISADGRFVAYDTAGNNMVPGDTTFRRHVYIYNRHTGETSRGSVNSVGVAGNGESGFPSVSSDGRFVAFRSDATNLVAGDTNERSDVFVHDRLTGQTTRVSVHSNGTQGNETSNHASISGDGRFVAFRSDATNLVAGDTNERSDVFVHDRETAKTTRVSVHSNGTQANDRSEFANISADGRLVTFASNATNLVLNDTNGHADVFVHRNTIQPSAAFSGSPTSGIAPLTVNFTNQSSGDYVNCEWDFGEGPKIYNCNETISRTYTSVGNYTVSLKAFGYAMSDTETKVSYIEVKTLNANFSASPTSGFAPLTVNFSDLSQGSYTTCSWAFGDGATSTQCSPSHTYTAVGNYNVSLTVSGIDGSYTETKNNFIEVNPLEANFSASPVSGVAPLTVNFSDLSQGSYTTCAWAFGDGGTSDQCNPSHTYTSVGTYTVSLTVSGPGGSDTETKTNYIEVKTLNADFSASPTSGVAPLTVSFSDLSQGSYTTCAWTFGDGGSSNQCNPSHTYTSVGSYTVSLTVSGTDGSDTETKTNYVEVKTLNADFSASPTSGSVPLTVSIEDQSQGDYTTCAWTFGDGGSSDQCNPSHTYTAVGNYTVSFTVSGLGGTDTETKNNYIQVNPDSSDGHKIFLPLILH